MGTGITIPHLQHGTDIAHYTDVIMTTMASKITSLTVVYSIVYQVGGRSWIYVQHVNLRAVRRFTCCP